MVESLLNKILFIIFFMAVFNVGKYIWGIISRLRQDTPDKFVVGKNELLWLGLSISYIITTIFVGIKI